MLSVSCRRLLASPKAVPPTLPTATMTKPRGRGRGEEYEDDVITLLMDLLPCMTTARVVVVVVFLYSY